MIFNPLLKRTAETIRKRNPVTQSNDYFIDYIDGVQRYKTSLIKLSERWDLLTLLGQMSNIGMDMSSTKEAFQNLTDDLMRKLTNETVKKTTDEFANIAQVSVDIVIRNLFERTADIGFLATDDDVRAFLVYLKEGNFESESQQTELKSRRSKIIHRFREYTAKYSVYRDIILLDAEGRVLAQLDREHPLRHSQDPLIKEALTTGTEYLEIYRHSDLCPHQSKSLIYAYRVNRDNSDDARKLGVLCLIFRFENEMEGIFANLKTDEDWFEIMLLDKEGKVIASSDPYHIPIDAKLTMELDNPFSIARFGGREYLIKSSATNGYQGFHGLGWYGHVMAPVEKAFKTDINSGKDIDQEILQSVMRSSTLFPDELKTIPMQADRIQRELNTTVWNGNVQIANTKTGDNSFSKSLLNEISTTGDGTRQVFEESIANLNATVVGSMLDNVRFKAALAIDIMDRNLYERANDCRWWALTSYFRDHLEDGLQKQPEVMENFTEILTYINTLYTVYTNLLLFDANGVIIAVSSPAERHLVGQKINATWVQQTLAIDDPQRYVVSDFEKSVYYANDYTYIYGAPILSRNDTGRSLGGIAIVFDSKPEFHAMLQDALPKDTQGHVLSGCHALFCDRKRRIIASTSEQFSIGDTLPLETDFFQKPNGDGRSTIIEHNDHFFVTGSASSKGYREYKNSDGYRQDIIAVVMIDIGSVVTDLPAKISTPKEYAYPKIQGSEPSIDISTFFISNILYGIESTHIVCSVTNQEITRILGSSRQYLGVIHFMGKPVPVMSLRSLIGRDKPYDPHTDSVIIADTGDKRMGLVVDRIGDSPSIPVRSMEENFKLGEKVITKAIVKPDDGDSRKEMLCILDVKAILENNYDETQIKADVSLENSDEPE